MIDINLIRENRDVVKENIKKKFMIWIKNIVNVRVKVII